MVVVIFEARYYIFGRIVIKSIGKSSRWIDSKCFGHDPIRHWTYQTWHSYGSRLLVAMCNNKLGVVVANIFNIVHKALGNKNYFAQIYCKCIYCKRICIWIGWKYSHSCSTSYAITKFCRVRMPMGFKHPIFFKIYQKCCHPPTNKDWKVIRCCNSLTSSRIRKLWCSRIKIKCMYWRMARRRGITRLNWRRRRRRRRRRSICLSKIICCIWNITKDFSKR